MYRLSCTLTGHTGDVRAAVEVGHNQILTGSRDRTAKLYEQTAPNAFIHSVTFEGHSNYVMSVAFLAPSSEYPHGLIATGSLDTTIMLWDPNVPAGPVRHMTGHKGAVCCLDVDDTQGLLASSSWDSTARVWDRNGTCLLTLAGHEQSVIAVKCHPSRVGVIVTGSADRTIRIWHNGIQAITLTGHTDAIRGLAVLNEDHFVSCANDASVRMWSFDGVALAEFYGHQAYIYSICAIPGSVGMFASSSEDGTVRVWRAGEQEPVQTVNLPCVSVWHVTARHNGDLVVCCDDGVARVLTVREGAFASDEDMALFDQQVAMALESKEGSALGSIKKQDLQDKSALAYPGRKEGDHKLINNNGKVEAYTWSMAKATWEFAGEVTRAIDPDYTFTIELDGKNMKLEYNKGENPYEVAQRFIHRHELSQYYLDEIAKFIIQNAETPTLEVGGMRRNPDPFTGGGAYVSGSAASGAGGGFRGDPFTGSGAYRTSDPKPPAKRPTDSSSGQSTGAAAASSGYRGDPFTSSGAYHTSAAASLASFAPPPKPTSHFPTTAVLTVGGGKADGILKKINEFNASVQEQQRLSAEEVAILEKGLNAALSQAALPKPEVLSFAQALSRVLNWPSDQIFPGLDILRLSLLWPDFVQGCESLPVPVIFTRDHLIPFAMETAGLGARPPSSLANQMLAWRIIANSFHAQAVFAPMRFIAPICDGLSRLTITDLSVPGQLAIATSILNFVSAMKVSGATAEDEFEALKALDAILSVRPQDAEVAYRALVAAGTLIKDSEVLTAAAQTLTDFVRAVEAFKSHGTPKVAECATAISDLFV